MKAPTDAVSSGGGLRIAVADDEPDMREFYRDALSRLGHSVVAVVASGRELVEACRTHRPDLILTDIKMSDMDGLDAAEQIYRDGPVPIVVVSAYHDSEFVSRAQENHVLAYLVKPIWETNLGPAIAIAMQRFAEFSALRVEADNLREALEDRKLIERAKGLLMKQAKLDEEAAFKRLQKLARDQRQKLVAIARMIVLTAEALDPKEPS